MKPFTFGDLFTMGNFNVTSNLTVANILGCLLVSFALAMCIFYVYRKTYSGVLYSKNFNVSLVALTMITSVVMMGISGNLVLALGMVGALSIVRFRAAIKDPKDIVFLFWAISVGIVNGVGLYKLALISSVVVGVVFILFSNNIFEKSPFLIILRYAKEIDQEKVFSIIAKHCHKHRIRSTTMTDKVSEVTIEVRVRPGEESNVARELKKVSGLDKFMMISYTGELSD